MEAKAKAGASAPKAASKAEKKEPAAPPKSDPAPAAPEPENPTPSQDGAAEAESAAGDKASGTDSLEHLKPFLIGGAVIAAGAILYLVTAFNNDYPEYTEGDALDALGLKRYCCRRMLLSHVDLIEKLLNYAPLEK
ncbi:hypothetical protein ILYODFUR_004196 [Ilyodon furcidens]|uniref:DNA-directed RNA polymerases I, II, and III subunit RPABC5 n=1 Tax=Ilyodon furcidens TaxID=33524 RepID=A0ABV0T6S1_9TELE